MAALFAYLLATGIFIASGYAGLVWLTNAPPDRPLTHAASSQRLRAESSHMRSKPNSAARGGEAANLPAGSGKQEGKKSFAQARKSNASELARELTTGSTVTTKELARRGNPTVPTAETRGEPMSGKGCTPIGMTAQGDLVFPMACREKVELNGQPRFSDAPTRSRYETHQRPKIPPQRRAEALTERSASAPDVSGGAAAATGNVQSKSDERTTIGRDRRPMRTVRRLVRKTNAPLKGERLPPLGRSGMVASSSNEWFNPLGLR